MLTSFRYEKLGWDKQIPKAERLRALFGDTDEASDIEGMLKTLRTMVDTKPIASGPDGDVERLIQQLPEEQAQQSMHPGYPEVFSGIPGTENSPAHQLARIGLRAAPKLIDALSDTRFTRSDGQLRVGDVALQILEEIAAGPIGKRWFTATPDSIPVLKQKARERFASMTRVGELDYLKKQLYTDPSGQAVNTVAQRYPEQVAAIFDRALRDLGPSYRPRMAILYKLAQINDPASIGVLKKEAEHGKSVRSRMTSAEFITRKDRTTATRVMIREWKRFAGPYDTSNDNSYLLDGPYVRDLFVSPMFGLADAKAIRCLTDGLARRPAAFGYKVVCELLDYARYLPATFRSFKLGPTLAPELGDTGPGYDLDLPSIKHKNSEIGDMAAAGLALAYPKQFIFKSYGSKSQMRRQRAEFKRIWQSGSHPL